MKVERPVRDSCSPSRRSSSCTRARFAGVLRERMSRPYFRRAATLVVPLWIVLGWLLPANVAQPNGVWALARRTSERPVATQLIDGVAGANAG